MRVGALCSATMHHHPLQHHHQQQHQPCRHQPGAARGAVPLTTRLPPPRFTGSPDHLSSSTTSSSTRTHRQLRRPVRRPQDGAEKQREQQRVPLLVLPQLSPELRQLVSQRHQELHTGGKQQALLHAVCTLDPASLTHRIKRCRSWQAAAVLYAQQAPCLNHINAAALLVQLAHLPNSSSSSSPGGRPANWRAFVQQVLCTSEPLLQHASARQLSTMAWALAKLGFSGWLPTKLHSVGERQAGSSDGDSWGQTWKQHVLRCLPHASCRDVSIILWALATATETTTPQVATAAAAAGDARQGADTASRPWRAGGATSPSSSSGSRQLAGMQQSRLRQELLSALHRTLPGSSPQDVANTCWALAVLQLAPAPELLHFLLLRAQSHFDALQPREVAMLLWSLAQLHTAAAAAPGSALSAVGNGAGSARPAPAGLPAAWLTECLQRQVGMPGWRHTQPRHYTMILVACAQLQQVPPSSWLVECLNQLQVLLLAPHEQGLQQEQQQSGEQQQRRRRTREAVPEHPASVRAALAAALDGPAASVDSNSNSSSSSSSSRTSRGGGNSSIQAGTHGSCKPTPQQQQEQAAPARLSQDLANTLWALASLRVKPNSAWMARYLAASAASLATAQPQELVNSVWALSRLKVVPDAAWWAAFDGASLARMEGFSGQGLADVLAAQVHLGQRPSGMWCEAWAAALKRSWGGMDARGAVKALWAAAKCELPLGRAWLTHALSQSHARVLQPALAARALSNEELLRLMWAVGRLCRGLLSGQLSDLLGLYICRAAVSMSGQQLVRGAWGLARLVPLPREGLLSFFHDLAQSRATYLPADTAEELGAKLGGLRDAAARAQWLASSSSGDEVVGVDDGGGSVEQPAAEQAAETRRGQAG